MAEGSEAESADAPAPARSLGFELTLTAFLGGLSLVLGLVGSASLLHGLAGYPLGAACVADGVLGSAAYVGLWWRRRYPVAYAGYVLVVSLFSTLTGGLSFIAAYTVASQRGWRTALITSAAVRDLRVAVAGDLRQQLRRPQGAADAGHRRHLRRHRLGHVRPGPQAAAGLRCGIVRSGPRRAARSTPRTPGSPSASASPGRCTTCWRTGCRCSACRPARSNSLADAAPQDIAAAAGAVRTTAHQALQELRSIVHVLRDDEDGTAPPQPVAADLPALLAESATAAASDADCGDLDLAEVPADTSRTLYRIVQEGLTNARKHAPGSAVEIKLTGTPVDGLSLAITSWLPVGRTAPPAPPGSGTGLIGLRERAVLSGGRIDVTVTEDDRFRLLAWLPWESA